MSVAGLAPASPHGAAASSAASRSRSGSGSTARRSPGAAGSSRSPHMSTLRMHPSTLGSLPQADTAFAQQLSEQLAAAVVHPPRKMSKSAPTSPMARPSPRRDLAPLSTITAIDMGGSVSAASGSGSGLRPMTSTNSQSPLLQPPISLSPAPHISTEARAQARISPEMQARVMRVSPEVFLKPLSPLITPAATLNGGSVPRGYPAGTYNALGLGAAPAVPTRGTTVPQPTQTRQIRRQRSRSRSRPSPSVISSRLSSGSEDTETEVDSDSTFVPGRVRHQHSRSQPDLSALRSRLVEGWADSVMRQQLEERRAKEAITRRRSHGRKTPPARPIPLGAGPTPPMPLTMPHSNSSTSLSTRSPRASAANIPGLSRINDPFPNADSSSEDSNSALGTPIGGMTGSEDGDDDLESLDSPSSGSLSFSSKRQRGVLRQRSLPSDKFSGSGLGLLLEPTNSADEQPRRSIDLKAASIEARLRRSSLFSFRLLAIVPSVWGIFVLAHAFITGSLWHDLWPWGVDFSREALERLVAGTTQEGIRRPVHRGDMALAMAWALLTAHFCFFMTTGLSRRWRSYYSLPSTVTRLVSLQCLCWPATYITLWILGPSRPLLAWVVIGVTTGCSRAVQMWVTSNVATVDSPSSSNGTAGDVTPGPYRRLSPPPGPPRPPPSHVKGFAQFTWGRRWDWDAVARQVAWKVGAMLLVTCAWLFWRIDNGWEPTMTAAPVTAVATAVAVVSAAPA